jgi:hypothetical protein
MTYFARYSAGEHVAVWDELSALEGAVRDPALLPDALSVASETMDRVATNIERLIGRLTFAGYRFGLYPDGKQLPGERDALVKPTSESLGHIRELDGLVGAIPLSLRLFWERIGSVCFIGRGRSGWTDYSDPLYVEEPRGSIGEYRYWQEDAGWSAGTTDRPFLCPIAPDVLHKDNVSGGAPYGIALPDPGADAMLHNEWHHVKFVPYLRIAILEWGGFPGLSPANPQAKWRAKTADRATTQLLKELTRDLVPF